MLYSLAESMDALVRELAPKLGLHVSKRLRPMVSRYSHGASFSRHVDADAGDVRRHRRPARRRPAGHPAPPPSPPPSPRPNPAAHPASGPAAQLAVQPLPWALQSLTIFTRSSRPIDDDPAAQYLS